MVLLRHHPHLDQHYEKAEGGGHGRVRVVLEDDGVYDYPNADLPTAFELLSKDNVMMTSITSEYIQGKVPDIVRGAWDKVPWNFSDWQKEQLKGLDSKGAACLLKSWLIEAAELPQGNVCNASWDSIFCWPPTANGTRATPTCSEVWEQFNLPGYGDYESNGYASRFCTENATWLWPDYQDCVSIYSTLVQVDNQENQTLQLLHRFLFVIPTLSTVLLVLALFVFWYFRRCIWCERITFHSQLMLALLLRSFMLVIITEPYSSKQPPRSSHFDFLCASLDLYATVASINWFFLQGILLMKGRWTTNAFHHEKPYRTYFIIGWVIPLLLIVVFALLLQFFRTIRCWTFTALDDVYLYIWPTMLALIANLLFLSCIMRLLCSEYRNELLSQAVIVKQAFKSTLLLFPLLGVNNLIFMYNPIGKWNRLFLVCHTICGSCQGIFIALFYCFVTREVRSAFYLEYRRFREERMIYFLWPSFFQLKPDQIFGAGEQHDPEDSVDTIVSQINCHVQIRISSPPPSWPARPVHGYNPLPTIDEEYLAVSTDSEEEEDAMEESEDECYPELELQDRFEEIDLNRKVIRETLL